MFEIAFRFVVQFVSYFSNIVRAPAWLILLEMANVSTISHVNRFDK